MYSRFIYASLKQIFLVNSSHFFTIKLLRKKIEFTKKKSMIPQMFISWNKILTHAHLVNEIAFVILAPKKKIKLFLYSVTIIDILIN